MIILLYYEINSNNKFLNVFKVFEYLNPSNYLLIQKHKLKYNYLLNESYFI